MEESIIHLGFPESFTTISIHSNHVKVEENSNIATESFCILTDASYRI